MNVDELARLPVAWRPQPGDFAASSLGRMAARHGLGSYEEVAARAVTDPAWFWAAAAADVGLRWLKRTSRRWTCPTALSSRTSSGAVR